MKSYTSTLLPFPSLSLSLFLQYEVTYKLIQLGANYIVTLQTTFASATTSAFLTHNNNLSINYPLQYNCNTASHWLKLTKSKLVLEKNKKREKSDQIESDSGETTFRLEGSAVPFIPFKGIISL